MEHVTPALTIVEEWKKKCCEFSTQSDDVLIPVITKVFDSLAMVLKSYSNSNIQMELKLLEYERLMCLASEEKIRPSNRILMYGAIQAVHGVLMDMTAVKDSASSEANTIIAVVEEWKRKCCDFSAKSEDFLISVLAKLFEVIALFLKKASHSRILLALNSLETERSVRLSAERTDGLSIRTLMYGLVQGFHGTLLFLTTLKESVRLHEETHNDEIANLDLTTKEIPVKKEEIEDETIDRGRDTDLQSLNGFSTVPNFTVLPIEPKKEPIDISQVIPDDNHIDAAGDMDSNQIEKGEETEENQTEKEEQIDEEAAADILKDPSENIKVEKMRRSSRNVAKRSYDEDAEPSAKKSRSDSKKKNELDKKSVKKEISKSTPADRTEHRNHTALECPECEYRAASVMAWVSHLRSFHSTTPSMAGLVLRCECGNESYSDAHSRTCKISKITVVPHEDGTTKEPRKSVVSRMNHTELECPECEFRTMTVVSWRGHLFQSHSTTPSKAGYILRCECGNESLSERHSKSCEISKITVVRKEDGTTKESQAS